MRSTPELVIRVEPEAVRPGQAFDVVLELESPTETPVDRVELSFTGICQVPFFTKKKTFDARTLAPGAHRFEARFRVPEAAPPSHASATGDVRYHVRAWVDVPWWPDATAQADVHVTATASNTRPPGPAHTRATSDARDATEADVALEASLDVSRARPGGVVHGLVAVTRLGRAAVTRLDVALVQLDTVKLGGASVLDARRVREARVRDGASKLGAAYAFSVAIPDDAVPSFDADAFELGWAVEARATLATGETRAATLPFVLAARDVPVDAVDAGAPPRAPAVGDAGRAAQLEALGAALGLRFEPGRGGRNDRAALVGERGNLSLRIELAPRPVARLAWPSLDVDLDVRERAADRGPDSPGDDGAGALLTTLLEPRAAAARIVAFFESERDAASADGASFGERFTARAREAAQLDAVVMGRARTSLMGFGRARVHDAGATLEAVAGAPTARDLDRFVKRAARLADELAPRLARVPPPAALAAHAHAWRAHAERVGARFSPGGLALRGVFEGFRVAIATTFAGVRAVGTRVELALDPPLEAGEVPGPAEAAFESLREQVASVEVTKASVKLELASVTRDPAGLEPVIADLVRFARALRGERIGGPYR